MGRARGGAERRRVYRQSEGRPSSRRGSISRARHRAGQIVAGPHCQLDVGLKPGNGPGVIDEQGIDDVVGGDNDDGTGLGQKQAEKEAVRPEIDGNSNNYDLNTTATHDDKDSLDVIDESSTNNQRKE